MIRLKGAASSGRDKDTCTAYGKAGLSPKARQRYGKGISPDLLYEKKLRKLEMENIWLRKLVIDLSLKNTYQPGEKTGE